MPDANAAFVGLALADERAQQRRLARAVRPDECDVLAALECERRVVQQFALADPERDVVGLDDGAAAAGGLMKPKPSRRERRVRSEISPVTCAFSCDRRPICVSLACACFAFDFL